MKPSKNMKPLKQYKTVRELLDSPRRWIKGMSAAKRKVTIKGLPHHCSAAEWASPLGRDARCFCLSGAITRIYLDLVSRKAAKQKLQYALSIFAQKTGHPAGADGNFVYFNDCKATKHKHIKAVLKLAKI